MGVSTVYLKKNYNHELKCGKEIANALVTENMYQQAMKDSPAAMPVAMFIAKTQMKWREKDEENSAPRVVFDFGSLTYEERQAIRQNLLSNKKSEPITIDGDYTSDE